jgi:diguanylate cyclase (GGDEF)-like protein
MEHDDHGLRSGVPGPWILIALPLVHFASVRLSFFCAVTGENEVIVWLPNAVLLAALLHFNGKRGWLMALLTYTSDVLANLPNFRWEEAIPLSAINLAEIVLTYTLLRRARMSAGLERIQDLLKLVFAGPVFSAALAGLAAAAVLSHINVDPPPYFTLMRVWWFGDATGLLIFTPLLLTMARADAESATRRWWDWVVAGVSITLIVLMFRAAVNGVDEMAIAPTVLLPSLLYFAARFDVRWTTLAVALLSLSVAKLRAIGHDPLGGTSTHAAISQAQELIVTICVVGLGFAVVLRELRTNEHRLEQKVRERTREIEASNARLETLSTTDGLTGVANRRHFDQVLANEWVRARRTGQPVTLVMMDVDLFKSFNDQYGHQRGDECLQQVARTFQTHTRQNFDLVARYGGEEFAVIAPATDAVGGVDLAAQLCKALEDLRLPHIASPFGVVTVSIGVAAIVPVENETPDLLIARADEALYQAKAIGRNIVVLARSAEPDADDKTPDSS